MSPNGKRRNPAPTVRIGCAGWNVPAAATTMFPLGGTHLERYARVFNAVEVNSSFYRPHQVKTYRKWADSVPADFRFCVKMPKTISHLKRLTGYTSDLETFLGQVQSLENKLGCLLLQLPPSLVFDEGTAQGFFAHFVARTSVPLVCEPRHVSWFSSGADQILESFGINRAGADPAICTDASIPFGAVAYLRLHGSPRVYYDAYSPTALQQIASTLTRPGVSKQRWCIFDNTAQGHAVPNALALMRLTQ